MLSIANTAITDTTPAAESINVELYVALAPEEIATLTSLMNRYDQLLLEIDSLTERLQTLLDQEIEGGKR